MRPVRLELEGFTTFREKTVVDFADAELFALIGPTGAGKSSLIDAMVFALYGAVPRFEDDRLVGAVVSQGRVEAKVRFDFTVGERHCTAVRVVRVRDGKASTREARFERDGEVLAGAARDVDRVVSEVLGLDLRQFTTCVVLPQGQFARFLQDEPRKRQDLLVRLLELGLYDRLRDAAGRRAERLDVDVATVGAQLAALGETDAAALIAARNRVDDLTAAVARVERTAPVLEELRTGLADVARALEDGRRRLRTLAELTVPAGVDELAARVAAARAAVAEADADEADALAVLEKAEATAGRLGEREPLRRLREAHDTLVQLAARAGDAAEELEKATGSLAEATARAGEAAAAVTAAEAAHEQALTANRAAAVREHLVGGEPCPVCGQAVEAPPPPGAEPPDLARTRQARERAQRDDDAASQRRQKAELGVAAAAERHRHAAGEVAQGTALLDGAPGAAELDRLLAELDASAATVGEARTARDLAVRERRRRHGLAEAAAEHERTAWVAFDAARDAVAALGPPPARRDDLGEAWAELAEWARSQVPVLTAALEAEAARQAELTARQTEIAVALDEVLAEVGVAQGRRSHRDALVEAAAVAAQRVTNLERAAEQEAELMARQRVLRREHDVARTLRSDLQANRFEKWVLDQALRELCATATTLLRRLSQEAYSLALDDKRGFMVVDHRNADELRLARTLSGGETFLASLALALALAEQVAMVAPGGTARLESIFLDEGFGTLDPETLDIVAGAIEDLGAAGRMVGLVSHVPELAERVPVCFEVRRGPHTSTVTRVDR